MTKKLLTLYDIQGTCPKTWEARRCYREQFYTICDFLKALEDAGIKLMVDKFDQDWAPATNEEIDRAICAIYSLDYYELVREAAEALEKHNTEVNPGWSDRPLGTHD
jgi:hypothetical protein